jgi:hypothetical protein
MVTGCGVNTVQALLDGEFGPAQLQAAAVDGLPGCCQKGPYRAAISLHPSLRSCSRPLPAA